MPVLEKNDGLVSKVDVPTELRTALNSVDERMRVSLMVEASDKYHLTDTDFSWLLVRCSGVDLSALARNTNRFPQVWSYVSEHAHVFRLQHVLDLAMGMSRPDLAIHLAKESLITRSLSDQNREDCLNFLQMYCLGKTRSSQPLDEDDLALFHLYLSKGIRNNVRANLETHLKIATAVGDTTSIETVWHTRILLQARMDTSDFGEDDDRDSCLESLYNDAVKQLPNLRQKLAEYAVSALEHVGRKMLAGRLARKLGLTERAQGLFLAVRADLLKRENPFSGCEKSKIGDCSYLAGQYEAAYGYYLLAGDKFGMFKAAWEFDKAKAIAVAREIAAEAIEDPYHALNGALPIVLQAGLPEAQQVYQKGIERLEQNAALESALKYAEAYGDTVRVARYRLLMTLVPLKES